MRSDATLLVNHPHECKEHTMTTITTKDGVDLHVKDWGQGPVVTFSHGWPLNSEAWAGQMLFLAQQGYRVIAHDRRGHGRSAPAGTGNDMDTYADDLAHVLDTLDVRDITMVGHSTGGGEVTRYLGRHGSDRVAKAVLISAVPPIMVKTDANPEGIALEVFDGLRAAIARDRAQFYREFGVQFFGTNREGTDVSQGVLDAFWAWCMQVDVKTAYECVKAFSETDFTTDLERIDVPTLILHGEDDQVVPVHDTGMKSEQILRDVKAVYYPGGSHGITTTLQDEVNSELLRFIES
jgi:non-heme chloroperoxidase